MEDQFEAGWLSKQIEDAKRNLDSLPDWRRELEEEQKVVRNQNDHDLESKKIDL